MRIVSENSAITQENENLRKELDVTKDQLESLQKNLEASETKSKTDLKVLGKEVKSLRSSQTDIKQELSNLMKEKLVLEVVFIPNADISFIFHNWYEGGSLVDDCLIYTRIGQCICIRSPLIMDFSLEQVSVIFFESLTYIVYV